MTIYYDGGNTKETFFSSSKSEELQLLVWSQLRTTYLVSDELGQSCSLHSTDDQVLILVYLHLAVDPLLGHRDVPHHEAREDGEEEDGRPDQGEGRDERLGSCCAQQGVGGDSPLILT